jgi:trk system potassium uptake protein TrkA
MRVMVIGAGLVGATVVDALHREHELTVIDLDVLKLRPIAQRYDAATVQASASSPTDLADAGLREAELVIACTSDDEANLVAGTFARSLAPRATTIVRTSKAEYEHVWRQGRLDVDYVVSSEFETARAVSAAIGMPTARHTDTFAEGQVQIVELDVGAASRDDVVRRPLRTARLPDDSRVAAVIRDGKPILPDGGTVLDAGDRVVVVGSPAAAREWADLLCPARGDVREVVLFGGQDLGVAIAHTLLDQGIGVRLIEADRDRAELVAELLPRARVFNTNELDSAFLRREGIGRVQAAIFAMRDDSRNLFVATFARSLGVAYTIALAHEPISVEIYDYSRAVDVTVDPRLVTAEEIVRFAHDPRTQQVSMLEGERFVVLDITTRPESEYVGLSLREMPIRGALIGAIVRDGKAIFPHSEDVLQAGDRVVVFTEASRAPDVERVL